MVTGTLLDTYRLPSILDSCGRRKRGEAYAQHGHTCIRDMGPFKQEKELPGHSARYYPRGNVGHYYRGRGDARTEREGKGQGGISRVYRSEC